MPIFGTSTREVDDITDDLAAVPLDGRIAAGLMYEEEIDLLAQSNEGAARSCDSTFASTFACCS